MMYRNAINNIKISQISLFFVRATSIHFAPNISLLAGSEVDIVLFTFRMCLFL